MRDSKGGYLTGLTNIRPPENVNYAGAPCAWQGWCVAAGAAMVADCFRLSGHPELQARYLEAALEAYHWASAQEDAMLDVTVGELRGRDLRMTAAAFLFNLTGELHFEDIVIASSMVKATDSQIMRMGEWAQQYATVGYLLSPQPIRDAKLQKNMKHSILHQARVEHVLPMQASATRSARWTIAWDGMAKTSAEMTLAILAHKWSQSPEERARFASALHAEAEWTLGRNPLGLVQMTGLTDRSITQTFAPGRRDGAPGLTPGWTPYMCRDGWGNSDDIHRCEWYTNRNYPGDKFLWPEGEHFWNSRYSVPNSEATPHQTFRQKILLYGYLHAIYSEVARN
jgi:endoglucanase